MDSRPVSEHDNDSVSISSTAAESLGTMMGESLHTIAFPELEKSLSTNLKRGLTKSEAEARLLRDGPNLIKSPPPKYFTKVSGWRHQAFVDVYLVDVYPVLMLLPFLLLLLRRFLGTSWVGSAGCYGWLPSSPSCPMVSLFFSSF